MGSDDMRGVNQSLEDALSDLRHDDFGQDHDHKN
jgi:hypothetical protein